MDRDAIWVEPDDSCGTGVLVLAGSSGRIDHGRAARLAAVGATVLAIRWFGGAGQRPSPHEVPIELFLAAVDTLAARVDRVAIAGVSFGAEAALLTASHDPRIKAVVAFAPTSVVWAGYSDTGGWSSHWTFGGVPVPYVPFVEEWRPDTDPPAYRGLYEASLAVAGLAAEIAVERIAGDVVLVAGGDDQVWPSVEFAQAIAARRARHGQATVVITDPAAGHRIRLPDEPPVTAGRPLQRGGTPAADAELGRRAWPSVVPALRLHPGDS